MSVIFKNPATEAKIQLFLNFLQKTLWVNCFQKWHSRVLASLYFGKKIRKLEIGQNVPNLHNFYRAGSAFSQRSYKPTKNYLGFIFFHKLFFIPWSSFLTIFHLQLNFFFVCNHPRKVHYIFYSVCTLNFAIFQTTITSGVYECT